MANRTAYTFRDLQRLVETRGCCPKCGTIGRLHMQGNPRDPDFGCEVCETVRHVDDICDMHNRSANLRDIWYEIEDGKVTVTNRNPNGEKVRR